MGILWNIEGGNHFLTSILASIPCSLGVDPIRSCRLITALFELILVSGAYKLVSRKAGGRQMGALYSLHRPINQRLTPSGYPGGQCLDEVLIPVLAF